MMGPSHRLFAAACYTAWAVWAGQPVGLEMAAGAVIATATSAGWSSPDVDQEAPLVWLGRALGPAGRLVAHRRGITHSLALLAVLWAWWLPQGHFPDPGPVTALLIGWTSHVVGDAIFGTVSILPGVGPMIGLSLRTGGRIEGVAVSAAMVLAGALVVSHAVG